MFILRKRPIGTVRVPVIAAGVSSLTVISRTFGTTFTHLLCFAIMSVISFNGTSLFILIVSAWLWHRMAPTRTQVPSIGTGLFSRPRILFVSAWPFHSSLLWPFSSCLSIHGITEQASGTPKNSFGYASDRTCSDTFRSMSRMAPAGSSSSVLTEAWADPICLSNSRILFAPAPEAAW